MLNTKENLIAPNETGASFAIANRHQLRSPLTAHRLFRRGAPIAEKLADLEAVLRLTLTFFVLIACIIGGCVWALSEMFYRKPRLEGVSAYLPLPVWMVATYLQWKTAKALGNLEVVPHPRPLWIAALRPRHGPIMSILLAAWWFGQASLIVGIAHLMAAQFKLVNPAIAEKVIVVGLHAIIVLMSAYASHCFYLLGVSALFPQSQLLARIYAMRMFIDIAITAILVIGARIGAF